MLLVSVCVCVLIYTSDFFYIYVVYLYVLIKACQLRPLLVALRIHGHFYFCGIISKAGFLISQ